MGSSASKPHEEKQTPLAKETSSSSGGCPIKRHDATAHNPARGTSSGCPVKHQEQPQQQYNVYSQPIDPTNQMPAVANQLPSPQQTQELSTERVKSTIPKGGAEEGTTWTYPSPQMFYNALTRKRKLGDTDESDIDMVVALHNNMNERTWSKVLEWEAVSCPDGDAPKLLKFMGRPSDLSPKARFKHWVLGHPLPFDRHDWTVLRRDGTTVRYVIDYYHDNSRAHDNGEGQEDTGMPDLHNFDATPSLLVDVRPALDGPMALVARAVKMPYARQIAHSTPFEPLPMMPTSEMKSQVQESLQVWDSIQKARQQRIQQDEETETPEISEKEADAIAKTFGQMLADCRDAQEKVSKCDSEEECARASMDLTLCMAKALCPLQHSSVVKALQESSSESEQEYNARLDKALENMSDCLATKSHQAQKARTAHPDAFE